MPAPANSGQRPFASSPASSLDGRRSRRLEALYRRPVRQASGVVTIDDVRVLASALPRSYEAIVADRVKFRVGRIVYLAFSRDEKIMGFGFPKEERELLVSSEPDKFRMPSASDMRYNWAHVRLDAIDHAEMRELVLDAWQMVVPKKVAADYLQQASPGPGRP
jgi:hypothetical protein